MYKGYKKMKKIFSLVAVLGFGVCIASADYTFNQNSKTDIFVKMKNDYLNEKSYAYCLDPKSEQCTEYIKKNCKENDEWCKDNYLRNTSGSGLSYEFVNRILPGAFESAFKKDNTTAFNELLDFAKNNEIDLNNNFASESPIMGYNLFFDIVENNAINCFKILQTTNFDFSLFEAKDFLQEKIKNQPNNEKLKEIMKLLK